MCQKLPFVKEQLTRIFQKVAETEVEDCKQTPTPFPCCIKNKCECIGGDILMLCLLAGVRVLFFLDSLLAVLYH